MLYDSNSGDGSTARKRAASNSPQADPPNKKRVRVLVKTAKKTGKEEQKESSRGRNKRGAGRGRRGGSLGRGSKRASMIFLFQIFIRVGSRGKSPKTKGDALLFDDWTISAPAEAVRSHPDTFFESITLTPPKDSSGRVTVKDAVTLKPGHRVVIWECQDVIIIRSIQQRTDTKNKNFFSFYWDPWLGKPGITMVFMTFILNYVLLMFAFTLGDGTPLQFPGHPNEDATLKAELPQRIPVSNIIHVFDGVLPGYSSASVCELLRSAEKNRSTMRRATVKAKTPTKIPVCVSFCICLIFLSLLLNLWRCPTHCNLISHCLLLLLMRTDNLLLLPLHLLFVQTLLILFLLFLLLL